MFDIFCEYSRNKTSSSADFLDEFLGRCKCHIEKYARKQSCQDSHFKHLPLGIIDSFGSHDLEIRQSLLRSIGQLPEIFHSSEFKVSILVFIESFFDSILLKESRIRSFQFITELLGIFILKIIFDVITHSHMSTIHNMDNISHFKLYQFVFYLISPTASICLSVLLKIPNSFFSHSKISLLMIFS